MSCCAPFFAGDERNVTAEKTADPSTALRSGRDDKFVVYLTPIFQLATRPLTFKQICHPDRSVAQWRDLRFLNTTLRPKAEA